ncbi:MAG: hypothetical protein OEY49_00930 [Candidatus Heimdallarchaeota archaeon]|nr:hypothetical protein [Candidatus Heimdallarchaeota archaeon]
MTEEKQQMDRQFITDALGLLAGFAVLFLISTWLFLWESNRAKFYLNNPNIPQGTVIYLSLFFLLPVLLYASLLTAKGLVVVTREIFVRGQSQ